MNRQALIAFLIISVCVVVPFLYYYWRRNPNPRFRPKFGEMVLVALLAFGFTGGGSLFMAQLMGLDVDPKELFKKIEQGGGRRGGPPTDDELESGAGQPTRGGDDPFSELFGE